MPPFPEVNRREVYILCFANSVHNFRSFSNPTGNEKEVIPDLFPPARILIPLTLLFFLGIGA